MVNLLAHFLFLFPCFQILWGTLPHSIYLINLILYKILFLFIIFNECPRSFSQYLYFIFFISQLYLFSKLPILINSSLLPFFSLIFFFSFNLSFSQSISLSFSLFPSPLSSLPVQTCLNHPSLSNSHNFIFFPC